LQVPVGKLSGVLQNLRLVAEISEKSKKCRSQLPVVVAFTLRLAAIWLPPAESAMRFGANRISLPNLLI